MFDSMYRQDASSYNMIIDIKWKLGKITIDGIDTRKVGPTYNLLNNRLTINGKNHTFPTTDAFLKYYLDQLLLRQLYHLINGIIDEKIENDGKLYQLLQMISSLEPISVFGWYNHLTSLRKQEWEIRKQYAFERGWDIPEFFQYREETTFIPSVLKESTIILSDRDFLSMMSKLAIIETDNANNLSLTERGRRALNALDKMRKQRELDRQPKSANLTRVDITCYKCGTFIETVYAKTKENAHKTCVNCKANNFKEAGLIK
ncbi:MULTISPECIES: hypothetical protein [Bacillaceae]|uniref:Uncharacterized protein n=1 Tax=Evansella alkalicola TaxID=745819 RepID=A0ABS6K0A9_9BACI|nr:MULTISPECIES: hypothetical protein [Bacillaceae]MBU9723877.1 hypothetical protein [Bacillus alkalicola]